MLFYGIIIATILIPNCVNAQTQITVKSEPVSLNIRKKKLSPILEIANIHFTDENKNNCIDGMEKCNIIFSISNSGKGPAQNMVMKVISVPLLEGLIFNKQTKLSSVNPGEKIDIIFPVEGTASLVTDSVSFHIDFDEPLGFPPDPIELKIHTRVFQKPEVKIVDSKILTDNGTVTLGKSVELKVIVQNTGQGLSENVKVKFVLPTQNVYPNTEEQILIGTLRPGESRNISF